MRVDIVENGRIGNKLTMHKLSNNDMASFKGGAICVCDANFCMDCTCILIGGCICYNNYCDPPDKPPIQF